MCSVEMGYCHHWLNENEKKNSDLLRAGWIYFDKKQRPSEKYFKSCILLWWHLQVSINEDML